MFRYGHCTDSNGDLSEPGCDSLIESKTDEIEQQLPTCENHLYENTTVGRGDESFAIKALSLLRISLLIGPIDPRSRNCQWARQGHPSPGAICFETPGRRVAADLFR